MPVLKARRRGVDLRNHPLVNPDAQPSAGELEQARTLARQKPSTSFLQRKMQIGYSKASRIMELLESEGVVSARSASGMRTVTG